MCEGRMVSSTKYCAVAHVGSCGSGSDAGLACLGLHREFGGRGTRGRELVDDDFEGIMERFGRFEELL